MTGSPNQESDYGPFLEEQVRRLQCLVAYLLEKNELLRRSIAMQDQKG